jgi:hypothetical protein
MRDPRSDRPMASAGSPTSVAGPPSVKVFGSVGDGVTNDITPLLSCLAFSTAQHAACRVPAGATLAVGDVTVPSATTLIDDEARSSTIRRIFFSGSGNGVLHCSGCSNVTISDLGIDGNKSNEIVASAVVYFTRYSSITFKRAWILGAKGGNGVWLDNSTDRSASGLSTISSAPPRTSESSILRFKKTSGEYIEESRNF